MTSKLKAIPKEEKGYADLYLNDFYGLQKSVSDLDCVNKSPAKLPCVAFVPSSLYMPTYLRSHYSESNL